MTRYAKVSSDSEAIRLMNDSPYGLTATIWTNAETNPESEAAFLSIADELEAGTVFLNRFALTLWPLIVTYILQHSVNRCDNLDPALAWTGVKNSGRGVSLSKFGPFRRNLELD